MLAVMKGPGLRPMLAPALSRPLRRRLTIPPAPPAGQQPRRLGSTLALGALGLLAGYTAAVFLPRPQLLALIRPVPTEQPPSKETEAGVAWTRKIEAGLHEIAEVKELKEKVAAGPVPTVDIPGTTDARTVLEVQAARAAPDQGEEPVSVFATGSWRQSRPYSTAAPGIHNLSASTLRGPGKFAVPPLIFTSPDAKEAIFFMHLGALMCGHEGVVHGGLLATVCDEALARTAFLSLPNHIGVTATLAIKYRAPTMADQYVVVRTKLDRVQGRKAWSSGRIETLDGKLLVEANGLFVEPKMAQLLSSSTVREALG